MGIAKRVWDFSTSRALLHDGDRVILGVSGGPDSLCLLDVLHRLARRHNLALHVAHLNHGLRPEAAAEAEFVRGEAERRGCGFSGEAADVRALAQARQQSIETAARQARYEFLRRMAGQVGASAVAVAHTADDQAETVLMRLLRGTGLRGLGGMRPKRALGEGVALIRPLLVLTRAEVLAYCSEHNLAPRWDESNVDPHYLRNRVRHELLPALATVNPNLPATLARLAAAMAGDYDIWLGAVTRLWGETARPGEGEVSFERARWLALSAAEQRALLRLAMAQLSGADEDWDFSPLDAAAEFSRRARPGRSCQVAGGVTLHVGTDRIRLTRWAAAGRGVDQPRMAGTSLAGGWQFEAHPLDGPLWDKAQVSLAPRWTAYVDAARLAGPLELRARRRGDRFQPLGLGGRTMKLSDYFVNQKVPASQRGGWPLVTCGEAIVWVAGLRLDERFKVTDATQRALRLSFEPDGTINP